MSRNTWLYSEIVQCGLLAIHSGHFIKSQCNASPERSISQTRHFSLVPKGCPHYSGSTALMQAWCDVVSGLQNDILSQVIKLPGPRVS